MAMAANFIAAKFIENTAPLPVEDFISQELKPKRKTLVALTPSPRASGDGDSSAQGAVLSRLPTHDEEDDMGDSPGKVDARPSVSHQSIDRFALLSLMKNQELVKPDSNASAETKRVSQMASTT